MRAVLAALLVLGVAAAPAGAVRSVAPAARALADGRFYIDPAVEGTVDDATRARLTRRLESRREPILVALVAFAAGDSFDGDGTRFLTALAGRTQRRGIYVTYDARGILLTLGYRTPNASDELADQAARVVDLESSFDTPPGPRLEAFLSALDDPDLTAREARASAAFNARVGNDRVLTTSADDSADEDGGAGGLLVVLAVIALLLLGVLVALVRRRRHARPVHDRPVLPERVFALARDASRDELAERAQARLIELSALMDATPDGQDVQRALDAYEAAERVLAGTPDIPDLVGALVCVDLGRASLSTDPHRPPPCTYDPRHGPADGRPVRVDGSELRLCQRCRADVRASRPAAVLRDGSGRPYFENDTPWSKSGYGAWADPIRAVLDRP